MHSSMARVNDDRTFIHKWNQA